MKGCCCRQAASCKQGRTPAGLGTELGGQGPLSVRCLEQQILHGIQQQQAEVCKLLCSEGVIVHVDASTLSVEVIFYVHE